jgi:hypothetical protein
VGGVVCRAMGQIASSLRLRQSILAMTHSPSSVGQESCTLDAPLQNVKTTGVLTYELQTSFRASTPLNPTRQVWTGSPQAFTNGVVLRSAGVGVAATKQIATPRETRGSP